MPRKKADTSAEPIEAQPVLDAGTETTSAARKPDDVSPPTPVKVPMKEKRVKKKKDSRKEHHGEADDEMLEPKKESFYDLDFHKLDKDLSPEEQREWNAIYASYRAGSLLTGHVAGVDTIMLGETPMTCLVVFDYRVKILIPRSEVWTDAESEKSDRVLHNFLGAEVDYVVKDIDRRGNCAVASRKQAVELRRMEAYIDLIPEKDGAVLKAMFIGGMTYKEIASALHIDAKTIVKRKNNGLTELAAMYSRLLEETTQASGENPVKVQ